MISPVVIPLPVAGATLVTLAVVIGALNLWAERTAAWNPWTPVAVRRGAHRLGSVATPYRPRDWDTVTAELPDATENLAPRLHETRQRGGNTMWSWSDGAWNSADTSELVLVR